MRTFIAASLIFLVNCSGRPALQQDNESRFTNGQKKGQVNKRLEEASGLAASIANPGYLWTINDSGNSADVFLIDSSANIQLVAKLDKIKNRDWEDLVLGDGPIPGKKYLYVGDIGDNLAIHNYKYIYRFEEPSLKDGNVQRIKVTKTFVLKLPDGKRDCETLMINPVNNDLYIISKREENVHVYQKKFPFASDTIKPEKVMSLPMTQIVAGSISSDGREVLLKNYDDIFYWEMSDEKSIIELLAKPPLKLSYRKEKQGEAICWRNDGKGFYTLSESSYVALAYLLFYKRK